METCEHDDQSHKQHPIRLGIMCNGTIFMKWQASCLEKLLALDNVQVVLLIIDDNNLSQLGKIKFMLSHFNQIFFYVYMFLICRPRTWHRVDMTNFFSGKPSIRCRVINKGKYSQYFSQADIETIRSCDLDIILRFGFGIIRGEILKVPRYGVWSFHHDDEQQYRGSPPGFWEIYNGDNVTGAILQKLTDRLDGGIVLKKGFFCTVKYSYAKNIDQSYSESTNWPAQVCIDIINGNADYLNAPPSETKAPIYHPPNNIQMLLFIIKVLRNGLLFGWQILFRHTQWNIGIVQVPVHSFLESGAKPDIQWFPNLSKNKWMADPFGIMGNTGITILCEEFDYRSGKGVIVSVNIKDNTFSSQPESAIELPFHISYPYLVEHQGAIYCIPETHQSGEISLYKAKEFPHKWFKVTTLISNINGVDPTVFQYEGLWWLICIVKEQGSEHNLSIWYASELSGPWEPHAANPVKTDVRSSRPAGTPFIYNGNLYRPAQDCSTTYGGRIVLNRVTHLTKTKFREEQAGYIEPQASSPFPSALHTISSVGNFTLIDGKRLIFVPSAIKYHLIIAAKHIFGGVVSHNRQ